VNTNRETFNALYFWDRSSFRRGALLEHIGMDDLTVFLDDGETEDSRAVDRLQIDDRLTCIVNVRVIYGATRENRLVLILT
jgi:hypothetical protein